MKHFIDINDCSYEDIITLLNLADKLKRELKSGRQNTSLQGKTLGMIFAKSSTRTRVSFEIGMYQLGGKSLFLSSQDIQLGRGETIADTARVMSRYLDAIMIRTFAHQDVLDLAKWGSIPIINGLTDLMHPCQALADLQTIREKKGRLKGLNFVYLGDGNNMANSLLQAASLCGLNVAIATPEAYGCKTEFIQQAQRNAAQHGAKITISNNAKEAVTHADVIYTDTWISMGQESEKDEKIKLFSPYQVNGDLMKLADKEAIFMHCLPAYRGLEVTADVIDGQASVVFDQAENRLHAQKAILLQLLA